MSDFAEVIVIVEGPTEQLFVKELLALHSTQECIPDPDHTR